MFPVMLGRHRLHIHGMAGYIHYVHWASFTEVDWERKDVAIGSNPTTLRKSQKEPDLIIYHLFS